MARKKKSRYEWTICRTDIELALGCYAKLNGRPVEDFTLCATLDGEQFSLYDNVKRAWLFAGTFVPAEDLYMWLDDASAVLMQAERGS